MLSGDEVSRPLIEQPTGKIQPERACCVHRVCTIGSIRSIATAAPTNILPVQIFRDVETDSLRSVRGVDDGSDARRRPCDDGVSRHGRLTSGVESFEHRPLDRDRETSPLVVEGGESREQFGVGIRRRLDGQRALARSGGPFGEAELLAAQR
jgi:hypothetical protein